jgi:hypothetical protein
MGSYFRSIFLLSGMARLAVGLFFVRRIREVRRVPQIEASELLFSDFQRPWRNRAYGYLASRLRRRKGSRRPIDTLLQIPHPHSTSSSLIFATG